MTAIGIGLLGWSAAESLQRFEDVASKTFKRRKFRSILLTRLQEMMLSYAQDGQYSLTAIESGFEAAFGSHLKMFNPLTNDTRVAVTTTTAKESQPCLFCNYNGGKRPKEIGEQSTFPIQYSNVLIM